MTQHPFGYSSQFDVADLGSLSSAGVTSAQLTTGATLTFQVTLADVGTNVVIRFEGSLDGTNYFNLNATNTDTTLLANGSTAYYLMAPVSFVRFRLVSITGGTPTVGCKVGVM
jgi:hypothetical protein